MDEKETAVVTKSLDQAELAWDYPVRYGTPEWETLKTVEEQFNAYNIPVEILKNISTEELVKVCLAYPEWGLIHAYNSRGTGLFALAKLFNGFRELFNREDAATALMNEYAKIDPLAVGQDWTPLEQGLYSFQLEKIELFLLQKQMILKLNEDGMRHLKEMTLTKYQKKKMLPEIYSLWDFCPTVGICANIIEIKNANLLEDKRAEINYFKYYLMCEDIQFLDSIVELLNQI